MLLPKPTSRIRYRVVKVKGTNSETCIVVGIDFDKGEITRTLESMREPETRVYLQKAGASEKDVNSTSILGSRRPARILEINDRPRSHESLAVTAVRLRIPGEILATQVGD